MEEGSLRQTTSGVASSSHDGHAYQIATACVCADKCNPHDCVKMAHEQRNWPKVGSCNGSDWTCDWKESYAICHPSGGSEGQRGGGVPIFNLTTAVIPSASHIRGCRSASRSGSDWQVAWAAMHDVVPQRYDKDPSFGRRLIMQGPEIRIMQRLCRLGKAHHDIERPPKACGVFAVDRPLALHMAHHTSPYSCSHAV